jgi:hypothetical protein
VTGVQLSVEWALWGKEPQSRDYKLLECSGGSIGADSFTEAITRYSPGNLDRLPQVTVSWLRPHEGQRYLAMAIHDEGPGLHDPGGRKIVFTRYFCAPYHQIAEQAGSYQSMFAAFDPFRLEVGQHDVVPPTPLGPELDGPVSPLAFQVAGLLLTCRPVCILQADLVTLDKRLRFLDSVMALLPYGMRSELSASTWASSTAKHKLRLFFAGAERGGDEHIVVWDQPDQGRTGRRHIDHYLAWLANGPEAAQARLASLATPVKFNEQDIDKVISSLIESPPSAPRAQENGAPWPWAGSRPPVPQADVVAILRSFGRCLDEDDPVILEPDMGRLSTLLEGGPIPADDQQEYQRVLKENRLLFEGRPVPPRVQQDFYRLLVRLAFGPALTYQQYCMLEYCAGGRMHGPLLAVLDPSSPDRRAGLLIWNGLAGGDLAVGSEEPPAVLVRAAASEDLSDEHAQVLCGIALTSLSRPTANLDREHLREVLAEYGYLAGVLYRLYPREDEFQRRWLEILLRLAHGNRLTGRALQEVLDNPAFPPTPALFAAALALTDVGNRAMAERSYSRGVLRHAGFDSEERDSLLDFLPSPAGSAIPLPGETGHPGPGIHRQPSTMSWPLMIVWLVVILIFSILLYYAVGSL